ncbi:hypothetical protein FPANT_7225 [Fusarium pseudoanthophilum]|uniref:Uncharacterized protein n=1 Tax=Fusarium pseudoanthophilum TaxID=48495 RepID=A0A8H5L9Y7_9HYPO|nr:hypothetical protein FPANT_7225 [Fusarium pseudoanthophilum]
MDWDSERVNSRDNEKYFRRFTTAEGFGGSTRTRVAGVFHLDPLLPRLPSIEACGLEITRPPSTKDEPSKEAPEDGNTVLHVSRDVDAKYQASVNRTALERRVANTEWQKRFREQQKDNGRDIYLLNDDQTHPNPDALPEVTENHHARISEAKIVHMEPLSKANFKAVIGVLNSAHQKQDFDTKLAQIQRTITHVDRFLPDSEINDFIRSQEESEVVTEFRLANPDKEAELVKFSRQQYALEHVLSSLQPEPSKEGMQSLCQAFRIAEWPDLRLYPEREDVQYLKSHQVKDAVSTVQRGETFWRHTFISNDTGTGKTSIYYSVITANKNVTTWKWRLKANRISGSTHPLFLHQSIRSNGRVVVISTYPTWSSRAVLKGERLFVFKAGKVPELVMKQRTKARDSSEAQDEDVEDEQEGEATIKNYTASELNKDDIEFIAQNEAEAAEEANGNIIEYLSKAKAVSNATFEFIVADGGLTHNLDINTMEKVTLGVRFTDAQFSQRPIIAPVSHVGNAWHRT